MKNVCVFGASSSNIGAVYMRAAYRFGGLLAKKDLGMVFGGGDAGLMGAAARGAHENGGSVIGVIPERLNRPGIAYPCCDRLIVTPDMHSRKAAMEKLSDGFAALPGGFGTMDELMEVLTLSRLGYICAPVVILNAEGFFDMLIRQLAVCAELGFLRPDCLDIFGVASSPEEAVEFIMNKMFFKLPERSMDDARSGAKWEDKVNLNG